MMPAESRNGLEWDDSGLNLEPRWAREPPLDAIVAVCRKVLSIAPQDDCAVKPYAAGAFNKLYLVESSQGKSLLRVSLPVDPRNKTRGEVTTLRWIRRMTQIPVPKVIAFDDSQDNEIGFEWILMELMPGKSVYKRWRKLSMHEKTWVIEQVAEYQSQLFRHSFDDARFRSVGTLCDGNGSESATGAPKPGRLVSRKFFWGDNFNYDVARGPFQSSHDWLNAYLDLIRQEQTEALPKAEDDDDREEAEDCLRVATRLTTLLPKIFPSMVNPAERTVLWHDDLSLENILVDEDGKVTAVIDWECVSVKPLWVATLTPKCLQGPTREEEPRRSNYMDASEIDEDDTQRSDHGTDEDDLDNEGKNELYWIHLMEYEQTRLREVYAAKMRQLWPQWKAEVADNHLKADFLGAVDRCAAGWYLKRIEQWIDLLDEGALPRLTDILKPRP